MNVKRMKTLIKVMERVRDRGRHLDLRAWQAGAADTAITRKTEKVAHECGTACCVAGWLAVSREFKAAGGKVGLHGMPHFNQEHGHYAIAAYLEVHPDLGRGICGLGDSGISGKFYGRRRAEDITASDVIARLSRLVEDHEKAKNPA